MILTCLLEVSFLLTCSNSNFQICLAPPSFQTQRSERPPAWLASLFAVCVVVHPARWTALAVWVSELSLISENKFCSAFLFHMSEGQYKSNHVQYITQYMQRSHRQHGSADDFRCCTPVDQKPFEMSNWSLKVRSGLGLCWFEEAERKGVNCVESRFWHYYSSYFAELYSFF